MGLLRASSRGNERLNFGAIVDTSQDSGVEHGALLLEFTEAAVQRSDALGASSHAWCVTRSTAPGFSLRAA